MTRKLTFTDFTEFVLARLYDLDREHGGGILFDVNEIANELREPAPDGWPSDAVKELDDRGLVKGLRAMGGAAHATITGYGRMEVEEQSRSQGSITQLSQQEPATIVNVSGEGHNIAIGTEGYVVQTSITGEVRSEVLVLLSQVDEAVRKDETLTQTERQELLADLDSARTQLEKREPNKKAALAVLEPLAKISTISQPILKIVDLLT